MMHNKIVIICVGNFEISSYVCTIHSYLIDTDCAVKPGVLSCSGKCLLTTCEVVCLELKTASCARITTTSLTLKRDNIVVQQITRIESSNTNFSLNYLSPSTEYFATVRAENIVGYTLTTVNLLTLNGEHLFAPKLLHHFTKYYLHLLKHKKRNIALCTK